jgi:hypothetical protein
MPIATACWTLTVALTAALYCLGAVPLTFGTVALMVVAWLGGVCATLICQRAWKGLARRSWTPLG